MSGKLSSGQTLCLDLTSVSVRSYRAHARPSRSEATRRRIKRAVRELLAEGAFHTSTVEQVADRAGVSRATVYQHFGSRLELVDAICETFDENPALLELRQFIELPNAEEALEKTIANSIRFWSSEDSVLRELYGVAAIDPHAAASPDELRNVPRASRSRPLRPAGDDAPPGHGFSRTARLNRRSF